MMMVFSILTETRAMPRQARKLSASDVQALRAPGLTAVGGAIGLYLHVGATGARSWIVRLSVDGKRRDMGLGGLDAVPLAEARERAAAARAQALEGRDPIALRRHSPATPATPARRGQGATRRDHEGGTIAGVAVAPGVRAEKSASRRGRGSGAVTLSDVAKLAGVSLMSASRALNSPAQVSGDIRARVLAAVAETRYVANRVASSLASRHSRLVAAIVPSLAGPVFQAMVQSLIGELGVHGYQLMLGQSGYGVQEDDALLNAIIGRRPDGLVLGGVVPSEEGRQRLRASGIPVVETWDMVVDPIDMLVGFSHEEIATAVADLLLERGRTHLAFVGGSHARALRRARAFVEAARRHEGRHPATRQVVSVAVEAPAGVRSGRDALKDILARQPRTDAIFCSSDLLALGVLTEARAMGLRVPEDLAVVGFGDLPFAADIAPALTTVRIDDAAIGRHAARFIIQRAGAGAGADVLRERVVDVGFSIVERESA
jgi:LacI family gluconate utilization system Gnt-I transcriptional repressor